MNEDRREPEELDEDVVSEPVPEPPPEEEPVATEEEDDDPESLMGEEVEG